MKTLYCNRIYISSSLPIPIPSFQCCSLKLGMGLGMRLQLLHKYLTVTILNNELIMTISHSLNWVVTGQMLRNNSAIMLADISEGLREHYFV